MAMGARIREARGEMKQADVCARVPGLSQQALSNLEKRDSEASKFAPGIADALRVSLRWLLSGEGDKHSDWPFARVTRAMLAELDEQDRLILEGHLMQAMRNLWPSRKGDLPTVVVTIPDRRGLIGRQLMGNLKGLTADNHPMRRAEDKRSKEG